MKYKKTAHALFLTTWLMTGSATFAQEHGFNYENQQAWGGSCQTGTSQSPVSLALLRPLPPPIVPSDGEPARPRYSNSRAQYSFAYGNYPLSAEIAHNAVRLGAPPNPAYGFQVALDGPPQHFRLVQVHFHAPAEHSLRASDRPGHQPETTFALEAHLVHQAADRTIAVLAILFEVGAPNEFLTALVSGGLPTRGAPPTERIDRADLRRLLPRTTQIYPYSGSLTTPGCDEGVRWHIARTSMTASAEQINALRDAVGFANNRRQARHLAVDLTTRVAIWLPEVDPRVYPIR